MLITQTGKGLQYAGITRLKFRNRRLIGIENHLVPLDTISPDPKIAALVRRYEQAPELLRRVGETTVPMDKVALLNLQVDAILARTQTDFAFYNWNGMRIDTHAAAPFTVADVFAMEPFGGVLYQLPMRLSDLRELILNKFNYNGKEGHTVDIYPAGGMYTIVTNAEKQGVDVAVFRSRRAAIDGRNPRISGDASGLPAFDLCVSAAGQRPCVGFESDRFADGLPFRSPSASGRYRYAGQYPAGSVA
ncbi:MAG: 5'-nucleotidase C-terminal domain-containing protein [Alistipes indistinctus]